MRPAPEDPHVDDAHAGGFGADDPRLAVLIDDAVDRVDAHLFGGEEKMSGR